MSGGLFSGYPFRPNLKCIVITAILALFYWYAPPKNVYVLAFILWSVYIAISYYDYAYHCEDKLKPTIVPFGRYIWLPFKPKEYQQEYKNLPPEAKRDMDTLDHITTYTIIIGVVFYILWVLFSKNRSSTTNKK